MYVCMCIPLRTHTHTPRPFLMMFIISMYEEPLFQCTHSAPDPPSIYYISC